MKKTLLALLTFIVINLASFGAPMSGTYYIPSGGSPSYPSIAAAIAALNSNGVAAPGATFIVATGYTETALSLILNVPTAGATAPIIFRRDPAGLTANPKITISGGSSSSTDGGIIIAGTDYVTFEKIDLDASADATIEWGYALVKASSTAPFNGCQHVTIKGCNIYMNRTNVKSVGIYAGNHIATSTSALSITATSDACNDCQFDNNFISGAFIGISLSGYASTPSPFTLYDHNNEIGQYGKNAILNFGGANTAAYGIYAYYQAQLKIMNDSIVSGTGSLNRLAGILLGTGTSSNAEVAYNYISVVSNTTASQNAYGIWNNMGSTPALNCIRIHDNRIINCASTTTTSAAPLYGILNSATPDTLRIYNNTINGSILSTTGSQYVIRNESSANNVFINNNTVYNITNTGTGSITLIHNQSSGIAYIYSNSFYNCNANGGTVYGVYSALGTTANVYKNNFYNINSNNGSTATSLIYAIYNTSTPTMNIYNNFISDLKAGLATNNPSICGLYLTGGSFNNVYDNTIFLNASSNSTTFGTAAIYAGTAPQTTLRNNLIINTSTPGTFGQTVAYRRSSTAIGTYNSASNNNDFYVGTPGANNLFYYDGTTGYSSFASYKAYVTPADGASITENPPFINGTTAPYNLHIQTGVATLIESGGSVVSSPAITDDFDGNPRYPNLGYPNNPSQPATAPDMGADEFGGGIVTIKTLNISAFLQGLYDSYGTMIQAKDVVYDNLGNVLGVAPKWTDGSADHITVQLHLSTTHYDADCGCQVSDYPTIAYAVTGVPLSTTGTATVSVPAAYSGSYYLTIKHRNSIETTSALPVSFSGTTINYAFNALSQAYDGNMTTMLEADGTTVSPPLIFAGDVNQDGQVEAEDMNSTGNDAAIFALGYIPTDVYGDGQVESMDINITGNNAAAFVYMHLPN